MRTAPVLAALFSLELFASRPAIGQQTNQTSALSRLELTPFVAYRVGGSFDDTSSGETAHLHDEFGFAASLSYRLDELERMGLFYSRQSTTTNATSAFGRPGVTVQYIHLDETVDVEDPPFLHPYMTGALGLTLLSTNTAGSNSDTRFSIAAGGGLRFPVQPRIDVRLEGRIYVTFFDAHSAALCPPAVTGSACGLHVSSSTFVQYEFLLGTAFAF